MQSESLRIKIKKPKACKTSNYLYQDWWSASESVILIVCRIDLNTILWLLELNSYDPIKDQTGATIVLNPVWGGALRSQLTL